MKKIKNRKVRVRIPLEIKEKIKINVKVNNYENIKGTNQRSYENIIIKVNGKNVFEHRHIWEKHYGKIPENYFIHHINANKKDNRLSNLMLVTREEHGKLHRIINLNKKLSCKAIN